MSLARFRWSAAPVFTLGLFSLGLFTLGLFTLGLLDCAVAGGGPERTLLVVNADSPVSRAAANEYVRLRRIPSRHVVALDGVGRLDVISADDFRARIWALVRRHLEHEGLVEAIDLVVYSADFPYAIDFRADLAADPRAADLPENLRRFAVGSLTGLTYLARRVEKKDTFYQTLFVNRYYRRPPGGGPFARLFREEQQRHTAAFEHLRAARHPEAAAAFAALFADFDGDMQDWLGYALALAETARESEALTAVHEAVRRGLTDLGALDRAAALARLRRLPAFRAIAEEAAIAERGAPPALAFEPAPTAGVHRYYLAACLAYTGFRGNTLPEVLALVQRTAAVDGTEPAGTVYLLANSDVRAGTRQPAFAATVKALAALGRRAEILDAGRDAQDGRMPIGKDDVLGAVMGTAGFDWTRSRSRLLPAAIAEHLTSFGAFFREPGQTKASEFLRHGAAGTCGTVVEPYALAQKFPHPFLHVYYAEGCSLAEAFYQSVQGPYQLLVMGDPLARPFARFARVAIAAPPVHRPWSGAVEVRAQAVPAESLPVERLELWVDGRRVATGPPDTALPWDTRQSEDGHHEVRVVAVDASRVGTRSDAVAWIAVDNAGRTVTASARAGRVPLDGTLHLRGVARGARSVAVEQWARVVAEVPVRGADWRAEIAAELLGPGPVMLQARALHAAGPAALSAPLEVTVTLPKPMPARETAGLRLPGLLAAVAPREGAAQQMLLAALDDHRGRSLARDLERLGVKTPRRVTVSGEFRVKTAGLHELVVTAAGRLSITVGDRAVVKDRRVEASRPLFVALGLESGWHAVVLDLVAPAEPPRLLVHLAGADVAQPLAGDVVRHCVEALAAVKQPPAVEVEPGKPAAVLTDGNRAGQALRVPPGGVELVFTRVERGLAAVVLHAASPGKDSPPWPAAWTVEAHSGSGRWQAVRSLELETLLRVERPAGKHEIPKLVKLVFAPVSARALRIRGDPGGGDATAELTEIEVLRKR
ncbi:MAG: hypothetical protein JXQ29_02460 [Planctomycetes bacterium]|nr:hypothetical protein [Planctomycetota bacterium]